MKNQQQQHIPVDTQFDPSNPPPWMAMRVFKVTRYKATERTEDDRSVFETTYVSAHALAVADGDRTVFQRYRPFPATWQVLGPFEVSHIMTGVIEVEDVTPAVEPEEEESLIIT